MRTVTLKEFIKELEHMSNFILFVTGPTGAGKSTFVSNLEHKLLAWGIHPGKAVRENEKMKQAVSQSKNPTAPSVTERFIRNYVARRINALLAKHPGGSIAIDGAPRSVDQVTWCVNLAMGFKKEAIFVFLTAATKERRDRLAVRGDKDFTEKRIQSDAQTLPKVEERIKQVVHNGHFGLYYHINTGRHHGR